MFAAGDGHTLFAVLEGSGPDDGTGPVYLLASSDGGTTFTVRSRVVPSAAAATFYDLAMDARGHGRMTLYSSDDTDDAHPRGYYHYTTQDGGKTWTGPRHEADTLSEADSSDSDDLDDTLKAIDQQPLTDGTQQAMR